MSNRRAKKRLDTFSRRIRMARSRDLIDDATLSDPRFYAVIERFADLTGVPVILNTSFNRREPIVQTPDDAISCYLKTQVDVLVLGNFRSLRKDLATRASAPALAELQAPARYDITTVQ